MPFNTEGGFNAEGIITVDYSLDVDGGMFSYAGANVSLSYAGVGAYSLATEGGVFGYSGANVSLSYSGASSLLIDTYKIEYKQDGINLSFKTDSIQ